MPDPINTTKSPSLFGARIPVKEPVVHSSEHTIFAHKDPLQALAIAKIGKILAGGRMDDQTLTKILKQYYLCIPSSKPVQAFLTASERIKALVTPSNGKMVDLVARLAFVLRQIAITEIYGQPTHPNYREIFANLADDTPLSYLREHSTILPTCVLRALAKSLGIAITVAYSKPDEEIYDTETMVANGADRRFAVKLLATSDFYHAIVPDPKPFAYVGLLTAQNLDATVVSEAGTVAPMRKAIAEANQELKAKIAKAGAPLLTGDIGRDIIMALYSSMYPVNKDLDLAAFRLGTQQFFATMKDPSKSTPLPVGQQQATIIRLIENMAAWVVTNQVSHDLFFGELDRLTEGTASVSNFGL